MCLSLCAGARDGACCVCTARGGQLNCRPLSTLQFSLPELRVGTLDSLLSLSDDLVKTTTLVEAVVAKIRRQLTDLEPAGAEASEVRSVLLGLRCVPCE